MKPNLNLPPAGPTPPDRPQSRPSPGQLPNAELRGFMVGLLLVRASLLEFELGLRAYLAGRLERAEFLERLAGARRYAFIVDACRPGHISPVDLVNSL